MKITFCLLIHFIVILHQIQIVTAVPQLIPNCFETKAESTEGPFVHVTIMKTRYCADRTIVCICVLTYL